MKVFDWIKAANILKERQPKEAVAGLQNNLEHTSGLIWRDGKPCPKEETYTYLSSSRATPVLFLDEEPGIDCWIDLDFDNPFGWTCSTYWPKEALAVLYDQPENLLTKYKMQMPAPQELVDMIEETKRAEARVFNQPKGAGKKKFVVEHLALDGKWCAPFSPMTYKRAIKKAANLADDGETVHVVKIRQPKVVWTSDFGEVLK